MALLACSCLLSHTALAQPRAIDRVLFEPSPLVVANASTLPDLMPETGADGPESETELPEAPPALEQDIADYQQAVVYEELENGPFSEGLLESFMGLGRLYQQQGEHEEALEILARAEYISRINSGLHAPEQFEIVDAIIDSHLALGQFAEADEKQHYLLFIQQEYYGGDNPQMVPALENLGDWGMYAFNSLLSTVSGSGNSRSRDNPRAIAYSNLFVAQRNYLKAIYTLINNRSFTDPRLPLLEYHLIEAIYLGANRAGIMTDPQFYFGYGGNPTKGFRLVHEEFSGTSPTFINGRNAWQRMRAYLENNPSATIQEVTDSIIGMGDWHLLFNRPGLALDNYREAHRYLELQNMPEAEIARVLAPTVPQQLPAFTPLPNSRGKLGIAPDAEIAYDGYLDVSFRLTDQGNVRGLRIIGKSESADGVLIQRLRRLLRSMPFRPRFDANGEPLNNDQITLRYHFARL